MPGPKKKKSNQKQVNKSKTATKDSGHVSASLEVDALRLQTDRLSSMVEHLPAGAVYIENNQLMMNQAAEEITGFARDELKTLDDWFKKLYGEDAIEARQLHESHRKDGFPHRTEPIALKRKNGEQCFIEYAAYKFDDHEVWIMHDVTYSHMTEAALRDREERLLAIMNNVAEAIIVIDKDGLITDFNVAAENIFGYTADEITGQNVNQLMPSPYREEHDRHIKQYLKTHNARVINQMREMPGCRKDGSTFPLELTVTEAKHPDAFVGIMRDLSEHKELEKQIADYSTQEQERIGQEIHDELGQQLTGLSLVATSVKRNLANRNLPEAEQMDQLIDQLQQAIKNARALSRGLMPVPVTPEGLTDALSMLAKDIKNKTGIDCHFESKVAIAIKDRTNAMQIYRITQEAVNNAVKHANASEINITLDTSGNDCELTISDNGRGLQMDKSPEGLGIRIMRYRAGVIGFQLSIESSPKGTVVRCIRPGSSTRK